MKPAFEKFKTAFYKLFLTKRRRVAAIILLVLCFALIATAIMFVLNRNKSNANAAPVDVTTQSGSAGALEIFGEEEEESESVNADIVYKINAEIQNIEVASGDSEKDEDAEVNRDYGTNSSQLKPADSPSLSHLSGRVLPTSAVTMSSLTGMLYADQSALSGLTYIGEELFNFDAQGQAETGHCTINKIKYFFNDYGAKASKVGIDVSNHNGKIDWTKVKAAGVEFAIIRVGFRGYGDEGKLRLDSRFTENMKGAIAAGIDVGVYFYSQAVTVAEAIEEASVAVNYARAYKITYPIYFDTEFATSDHSGRADRLSTRARTDITVAFCEAVKNAGFVPGVYASKTFFTDHLNFSRLTAYQIWNAHYTSETTDFKYPYQVWQYTATGTVDGIPNKTDINISLYDYKNNSSMKEAGEKVAILDALDLDAVKKAENNIRLYILLKTDANYTRAANQIQAVSNERVREALMAALDNQRQQGNTVTLPSGWNTQAEATENNEGEETSSARES